MNGSDHRLDLSDVRARRALDAGCLLSLDSDAHRTEELHYLDWAVAQARRAWVPPERVLNTRSRSELLAWVAGKADRLAGSTPRAAIAARTLIARTTTDPATARSLRDTGEGSVRNRLTAILASVVVVLGACQASAPSSATPAPSVAPPPPTATPVPTPIDFDRLLYGSTYAPSPGTPGGTVVISNWQSVEQLNPYFANAFGTFEVLAGTMRTLLVVASDGHYVPDLSAGPITYADNVTEDGGAAGGFTVHVAIRPSLKWSDGQPLTLNDLAYTWQWVSSIRLRSG